MSELTFDQLCASTGKTDAELAELMNVKESTVAVYRKTNKPSSSAKDALAGVLTGSTEDKFASFSATALNVDREVIPTDFKDTDEWHFLQCRDSSEGGRERVAQDVATCQAGDEIGRYGIAHKFSDNFYVMKCPMAHHLAREKRDIQAAAEAWPKSQTLAPGQTGTSTKVEKGERVLQGAAGMPTGEPVAA